MRSVDVFNIIAKKIVFRIEDIRQYFNSDSRMYDWLISSQVDKRIIKIRAGLYSIIDPTTGSAYADKYMVASGISKDSYVSYHSALEFHGIANQVYNCITVANTTRFSSFEFDGIEYNYVNSPVNCGINHIYKGLDLKVTNLERTIIDCIHQINLAGGMEELFYALDAITILKEDKILEYLDCYSINYLYRNVGYILSHYARELYLSNDFLKHCKCKINNVKYYFLRNENLPLSYNAEWQLIAPKFSEIRKRLDGGF
ncbi:MAG: hypothetical protein LBF68_06840 [Christensenellaceae bacterium]|jgi:predicted transcriptional regulator of viral defense system|nr:hypothetical protein [Christensenellaceae bacterium]